MIASGSTHLCARSEREGLRRCRRERRRGNKPQPCVCSCVRVCVRQPHRIRGFWNRGPARLCSMVFKSMVLGGAPSGLKAYVLKKSDLLALTKCICGHARSVLRGKATTWFVEQHPVTLSNVEVWHPLRIAAARRNTRRSTSLVHRTLCASLTRLL